MSPRRGGGGVGEKAELWMVVWDTGGEADEGGGSREERLMVQRERSQ